MKAVSFLILNEVMNTDYREKIVKAVLKFHKRSSPKSQKRLEKALSEELSGSFQDPLSVRLPHLLPLVLKESYRSNAVLGAILNIWVNLHNELRENVYEFLTEQGESISQINELEEAFALHWTSEDMKIVREAFEAFQSQYPTFSDDDVMLMLWCLKGQASLTAQEQSKQDDSVMMWKKWLQELQNLPAASPVWDSITQYTDAITNLTKTKIQEREARNRLRDALNVLGDQANEELEYFEFDITNWVADHCLLSEANELAKQVENFFSSLMEHQRLRQTRPTTRSDDDNRQEEMKKWRNAIDKSYQHLANALTSPKPKNLPPSSRNKQKRRSKKDISSDSDKSDKQEMNEKPTVAKKEISQNQSNLSNFLSKFHTSKEIAILLQSDDREEYWHALLWAFVAEDNLPGAYWLARSLDTSRKSIPLPVNLLKAVQGAHWLHWNQVYTDVFVTDLTEIAKSFQPSSKEVTHVIIGLAAALRPSLIAPSSGMQSWLRVPSCLPSLRDLVTVVKDYSNLGRPLLPSDLQGIAGVDEITRRLDGLSQEAKRWLDEAPRQRFRFKRASDVWRGLTAAKGELRKLIHPVAENTTGQEKIVREQIERWEDKNYIARQIKENDQRSKRARSHPIEGAAYQDIVRNIAHACRLARQWYNVSSINKEGKHERSFLLDKVEEIQSVILRTMPKWQIDLEQLVTENNPASLTTAALCLDKAIKQVKEMLIPISQENTNVEETNDCTTHFPSATWFTSGADNLSSALMRYLLWFADLDLDDKGQPKELNQVAQALCKATAHDLSLHEKFHKRLDKQDYRFAEKLLEAIQDERNRIELARNYQTSIEGSRMHIQIRADRTTEVIDQALVDSIIEEQDYAKYSATVTEAGSDKTLDYLPAFENLRDIEREIESVRDSQVEEWHCKWPDIKKKLSLSKMDTAKQKSICDFVEKGFRNKDFRIVAERIEQIEGYLNAGTEIIGTDPSGHDHLAYLQLAKRFHQKCKDIEDWLRSISNLDVIEAIRQGKSNGILDFAKMSEALRSEACDFFTDWRRMKQMTEKGEAQTVYALLKRLLDFLGFVSELDIRPKRVSEGLGWMHLRIKMSANSSFVRLIPQFGSQMGGNYNVVCLWERQGTDVIATRLRQLQLNTQNVLILYFGVLTVQQRGDIFRICREENAVLALLDEALAIFLAQHEVRWRLPVFFRCALPYTLMNPYTPSQAGDVPPEMFFGRTNIINELKGQRGSCLVYGGRQLGKSTLLRYVKRQFHQPKQKTFAWIENMQLIFDPEDVNRRSSNIWKVLRDIFNEEIGTTIAANTTSRIANSIQTALEKDTHMRVLFMFDEADEFLDNEARGNNFREVLALRELMLHTEGRFKVVFAGLNKVDRFFNIPNQPLAHFGIPLCVGPLEPAYAQQLVQQPLEILGFDFVDDSAMLILAYTNYHPGLIQYFCHELLKRLRNRTRDILPPYQITKEDVEAVYRDRDVCKAILDRFRWTLALDPRYQVIALGIVLEQENKRDSFKSAYPLDEILRIARFWWQNGFKETSPLQLESLLAELIGLGVLVLDSSSNQYRLRSPNLIRLMGKQSQIEADLLYVSETDPKIPFDVQNHHSFVDSTQSGFYSPLRISQERSLIIGKKPRRFGVGIINASDALGLSLLEKSFSCYYPSESNEGSSTKVPVASTYNKFFRDWLENHLREQKGKECLMVYCLPLDKKPENLKELVRIALDFCRSHRYTKTRWVRILFLFDAETTWSWLSLPSAIRKRFENQVLVEHPNHWNHSGIQRRLMRHQKMDTDEVCERVLAVTGGWPLLLDELFKACRNQVDPEDACSRIERELYSNTPLRKNFRASLGLEEASSAVVQVLECICQEEGSIPIGRISSKFQDTLSLEECNIVTEYLLRMGCILKDSEDEILAEPIVRRTMIPFEVQ